MQITDAQQIRMYLRDYEGAIKDVKELSDAILEFTDKPVAVSALLDSLVSCAKFAGECWANLEQLGFEGTPQEALLAGHYAPFCNSEEGYEDFKGGENDG